MVVYCKYWSSDRAVGDIPRIPVEMYMGRIAFGRSAQIWKGVWYFGTPNDLIIVEDELLIHRGPCTRTTDPYVWPSMNKQLVLYREAFKTSSCRRLLKQVDVQCF